MTESESDENLLQNMAEIYIRDENYLKRGLGFMATLLYMHFTALKSTVFQANILLMRDLSVLTCFQFVCLVRSGFMCCCFPLSVSVAIKSVGP